MIFFPLMSNILFHFFFFLPLYNNEHERFEYSQSNGFFFFRKLNLDYDAFIRMWLDKRTLWKKKNICMSKKMRRKKKVVVVLFIIVPEKKNSRNKIVSNQANK